MTVKVLTDIQKHIIAHQYTFIKMPVKEIAAHYKVSARTINRVLVEMGVNKVKAKPIKPQPVVIQKLTLMDAVKGMFKAVFLKQPVKINVEPLK